MTTGPLVAAQPWARDREAEYPRIGAVAGLAALCAVQVYASSLPAGTIFNYFLYIVWLGVGAVWLLTFVNYVATTTIWSWAHFWRWPLIALFVAALTVASTTGLLVRARFELSRGSLEALAADHLHQPEERNLSWIGLLPVEYVDAYGQTTNIGVFGPGGCCLFVDHGGFARTDVGPPQHDCDGERMDYQHLDGPWYRFVCYW